MAETKQGEGLSFEAGLADELLCKDAKGDHDWYWKVWW